MQTQETCIDIIQELLLAHDCVIIPNFGGFVINNQDFRFEESSNTLYPKQKWVAFNERLQADDGLLAMHFAKRMGITQKKAFTAIHSFADSIKSQIRSEKNLTFGNIGTFQWNEANKLSFEPNQAFNFDLDQFGLLPVGIGTLKPKPILLANPVEKSTQDLPPMEEDNALKTKRLQPKFYAYVVFTFIIGSFAAYWLTEPNSRFVNSSLSPLTIKIKKEPKQVVAPSKPIAQSPQIQEAPIVEEPAEAVAHVYLVAGSFKTLEKAEKCKAEFIASGITNVEILAKEEGEAYFRVSVGRVADFDAGYAEAATLKSTKKLDIWVYKH